MARIEESFVFRLSATPRAPESVEQVGDLLTAVEVDLPTLDALAFRDGDGTDLALESIDATEDLAAVAGLDELTAQKSSKRKLATRLTTRESSRAEGTSGGSKRSYTD